MPRMTKADLKAAGEIGREMGHALADLARIAGMGKPELGESAKGVPSGKIYNEVRRGLRKGYEEA